MIKKTRMLKRIKELEENQEITNKAFGILASEINYLKSINDKTEPSIPENSVQMTPEEFMRWFISNS